jgi:phosphate-selective porin OprO/OprP
LWDVGVSGSVRTPDEGEVRVRTRGNIRSGPPGVLNPIYADTGLLGSDEQDIIAFETFGQYGRWSLQAEYAGTWIQDAVQLSTSTAHGTPFFHGGYVELLYFLTGDCRTYDRKIAVPDRVIPLENAFVVEGANGCCKGRGAWQIGFRYSAIDLNDDGINGGILNSGTLGLNWFLNPNTIIQFNYDLTHRSQVAATPDGFINGFGTRVAYNF